MVIGEVIKLREILDKLYEQSIGFSINLSYNLFMLRKEITQMFDFIFERLYMVLGDDVDFTNLSPEAKVIFDSIMSSEVSTQDIERYINGIDFQEFVSNKEVNITMNEMALMNKIFNKGMSDDREGKS